MKLVKTIVVIDHHRQSSEIIQNATLSYVEPYASSACELVAEILQYVADSIRIKSPEADAMYAGIVIDTNNFTNQAGVRTFEAGGVFKTERRGCGPGSESCSGIRWRIIRPERRQCARRRFIRAPLPSASARRRAWKARPLWGRRRRMSFWILSGSRRRSFMTPYSGKIYLSARSIDEINVQVMMEKLGGGGHRTIAGAQLADMTVEEAKEKIKGIIDAMEEKGEI